MFRVDTEGSEEHGASIFFVRTKVTLLFYYENNMQGQCLKMKDGD
jgi:hypothetical protein